MLKLQRFKINKNIMELYLNNFMKKDNSKNNSNETLSYYQNNLNYTYSSNNKTLSEIINSTSSEEYTFIKNNQSFK